MNKVFFYIYSWIKHIASVFMQLEESSKHIIPAQNSWENLPLVWQKNKLKMLQILNKAPITGIYKNQDPKNWNSFYKFYVDFLNAEIGPRGQCAKKIRQQLKQNSQKVDEVLKPYNLHHAMHIRSLYVRFKFFIPCQQYHFYTSTIDTLSKCQQSLFRLKQPNHPMYRSIMEGMIKKHGPQYPYQESILQIQQNYEMKIQKLQRDKIQIEEKLNQSKDYLDWVSMNAVMRRWFDEWVLADSGMGKDSCNRGEVFETKVLHQAIPYIIRKQRWGVLKHIIDDSLFTEEQIDNMIQQSTANTNKTQKFNSLHVLLNMKWNPRSLGQIDITIAEYVEETQRYEALILVQCKARLFDIREASYQVYPQYLQPQGKLQLSGKYGPVYLSPKVTSYIVTTLPDFDFVLPIESSLKATLDRITKDKPVEEIAQNQIKEKLFNECWNKFNQEYSPLQWFKLNDCGNLIVLSNEG